MEMLTWHLISLCSISDTRSTLYILLCLPAGSYCGYNEDEKEAGQCGFTDRAGWDVEEHVSSK